MHDNAPRCLQATTDMQVLNGNNCRLKKTTNKVSSDLRNLIFQHFMRIYSNIYLSSIDFQCDVICKESLYFHIILKTCYLNEGFNKIVILLNTKMCMYITR